jgi:hypothetical protein
MSAINPFARFTDGRVRLANIRRLLVVLVCFHSTVAMAVDCKLLDEKNRQVGGLVQSHESGRVTTGKGRVAFYSAPDRRCVKAGVFVLPDESLNAYFVVGEFTRVLYVNPKNGDEADGWVLSSRLKATGWGIGPN